MSTPLCKKQTIEEEMRRDLQDFNSIIGTDLELGEYIFITYQNVDNLEFSVMSKVLNTSEHSTVTLLCDMFLHGGSLNIPVENGVTSITPNGPYALSVYKMGPRDVWVYEVIDTLSSHGYDSTDISDRQMEVYYENNMSPEEVLEKVKGKRA